MLSAMHVLEFGLCILSLAGPAFSAPRARPETVGAGGTCYTPTYTIESSVKVQTGPFLVSGARSDANPAPNGGPTGGGVASFSNTYSVLTTITVGLGADLSLDYEKIATFGLGFTPSFSISWTTGTATSEITGCPANQGSGNNDTITWGLQYFQYSYTVTGTKTYGGYEPLMRECDADQIEHKEGGTFPWSATFPAKQTGALDDAQNEIVFQCCTDTESDPWPGSPVCPAAS